MAEPTYSDVNLYAGALSPYMVVLDESAVNQNILVLCDTPVGSKWFRPRIGSSIIAYLFDPMDQITADAISIELSQMLKNNGETRLRIDNVDVVPDYANARYYVEIWYSTPGLDAKKVSFKFYLMKER